MQQNIQGDAVVGMLAGVVTRTNEDLKTLAGEVDQVIASLERAAYQMRQGYLPPIGLEATKLARMEQDLAMVKARGEQITALTYLLREQTVQG